MNTEINLSFSWSLQDLQNDMWFVARRMAVQERLQDRQKKKRLLVCLCFLWLGLCLYGLFGLPIHTAQNDMFFAVFAIIAVFGLLSLLIPSWNRWTVEKMAAGDLLAFKIFKKKILKEMENAWSAKFGNGQTIYLKLKLSEEKIELFCSRTPEEEGVFWGCATREERVQYCRMEHCIFLAGMDAVNSGHLSEKEDALVMLINLQRLQPQEQEQIVEVLTASSWCEHKEDMVKDILKRRRSKRGTR